MHAPGSAQHLAVMLSACRTDISSAMLAFPTKSLMPGKGFHTKLKGVS